MKAIYSLNMVCYEYFDCYQRPYISIFSTTQVFMNGFIKLAGNVHSGQKLLQQWGSRQHGIPPTSTFYALPAGKSSTLG